jgi:23S rRNA (cytidine1920-2'-O)/16S rRNA (cytidine1409-2'-O)-methyltransferase
MTGGLVDLLVADLSFITLRLALAAFGRVTTPSADLVMMVKPQFEVGRAALPSGGVVRDPLLRRDAVLRIGREAENAGWGARGVTASPLPGPAGNVEYFLWLSRGAKPLDPTAVDRAIEEGPT